MITALLTGLAVALANILLYLYLKRKIHRSLKLYFEPKSKDEPSEFFQVTDAIAKQVACHTMFFLKQTSAGVASGEARQEKALTGALVKDVAAQKHPLLGLALNQFPNLSKMVTKNPDLLNQLGPLLEKMNIAGGGNHEDIEAMTKYDETIDMKL